MLLSMIYSIKVFVKHSVKLANTFKTLWSVLFFKHTVLGLIDASLLSNQIIFSIKTPNKWKLRFFMNRNGPTPNARGPLALRRLSKHSTPLWSPARCFKAGCLALVNINEIRQAGGSQFIHIKRLQLVWLCQGSRPAWILESLLACFVPPEIVFVHIRMHIFSTFRA